MSITDRSRSLYSSLIVAKEKLDELRYALQRVQMYEREAEQLSQEPRESEKLVESVKHLDGTMNNLISQIRPAIEEVERLILDIDLLHRSAK